jgi:small subunit ribosomal protein S1
VSFSEDESASPVLGMAELLKDYEPVKPLKRGDIVDGEVMAIDQEGILVNVGHKYEGVVPPREMRSLTPEKLQEIKSGSDIYVYVVRPATDEDQAILSLDRAQKEEGWFDLQKRLDKNEAVEGKIQGMNRGGAVVEVIGLQGFIPLSQLASLGRGQSDRNQEDQLAGRIGETVQLKILELNRQRNRLILSERLAQQQQREEQKDKLLEELKEGQVRKGRVSGIASFGAFIDLGGADGLIHISELSWDPVQSPDEVIHVGDDLDVFILKVDRDTRRIALSLRRLQPTPWDTIADRYEVGQLVTGIVTRLTGFGAFARIEGPVEGLIHISELTDKMIEHPKEVVREGDTVALKILKIEPDRHRLGLSLKQADETWEGQEALESGETEPASLLLEQKDGK